MKKRCTKCKALKLLALFPTTKHTRDGRQSWCRECTNRARSRWARTPAGKAACQASQRRWAYGLEPETFNALLFDQGYKCAGCGVSFLNGGPKIHVDHDHKTEAVRGLLCPFCNATLGYVLDNPATLEALIVYLKRWKTK